MEQAEKTECPSCGMQVRKPFFSLKNVPIFCNVLYDTEAAAKDAAKGNIELTVCERCGLIFNSDFDARLVEYSPEYENALHFSNRFRQYADALATRLVQTYQLADQVVAEIGCGDGHFLRTMLHHGVAQGIGFDPSAKELPCSDELEIRRELFGHQPIPEDVQAVMCRHVLEHIPRPQDWLAGIRAGMGQKNPLFYCEVPNGQWLLESFNFWDVIYEHVTYWTPRSLCWLFEHTGFEILHCDSQFGGQFLSVDARPGVAGEFTNPLLDFDPIQHSGAFADQAAKKTAEWSQRLDQLARADGNVVVWGAGSKGVTFASVLAEQNAALRGVVDLNPRKHGRFLPISGLPVLAPGDLIQLQPDAVCVMNANYCDEIKSLLADLGLTPKLYTVMDNSTTTAC